MTHTDEDLKKAVEYSATEYEARGWFRTAADIRARRYDNSFEVQSALRAITGTRAEMEAATHRHVKRGTDYVLLGIGKMQVENWVDQDHDFNSIGMPTVNNHSVDMREVAIYRSVDGVSLWVRPREEFEDGRFVALNQKDQTDASE